MSECVVKMTKPLVCITKDGYHGNCPMDRVWCIQRNAPKGITMGEAYAAMTDKVPSWCPVVCQLPEGHGRLVFHKKGGQDAENHPWQIVL